MAALLPFTARTRQRRVLRPREALLLDNAQRHRCSSSSAVASG